MATDDNYTNVLLEDMNSKVQALFEIVTTTMATKDDIAKLTDEFDEVKSDVKVIKTAVTDLSSTVNDHEARIVHLERRVA